MENREVLKAVNILKVYPNGIVANKDVNFSVNEGEIHALIGENGAGKSTLMKILFGMEIPEKGDVYVNSKKVSIDSPKKAISYGIGMVHQHFMLVDPLTIAENIALGYEQTKAKIFLDNKEINALADKFAKEYEFNIDVKSRVEDVSVGIKQKTEILKALVRGAKILILDEPTAVLTPQETRELFEQLRRLKDKGHTIIFISHKLKEIMEICDRITIMRNGTTVETCFVKDTNPQEISNKMVGRDVVLKIDKNLSSPGEVAIETKNLKYVSDIGKVAVNKVNLKLKRGEILGVAGVEGNGQAELAGLLTGLIKPNSGQIKLNGLEMTEYNPSNFRDQKLSYIPEDRMTQGVVANMTIVDNIFSDSIDNYRKNKIFIDFQSINSRAEKLVEDFNIKCDSIFSEVSMLSGGNIQKVVAARELVENKFIIIAEQPTRGIDAGASEIIRTKIVELRDKGAAVLLISADLNEILELSDKAIVMHSGKINAYFENTKNLDEVELGYYMLGVKNMTLEEVEM